MRVCLRLFIFNITTTWYTTRRLTRILNSSATLSRNAVLRSTRKHLVKICIPVHFLWYPTQCHAINTPLTLWFLLHGTNNIMPENVSNFLYTARTLLERCRLIFDSFEKKIEKCILYKRGILNFRKIYGKIFFWLLRSDTTD